MAPKQKLSSNGSNVRAAIGYAKRLGFSIGSEVLVGTVPGTVVAYNITPLGMYPGSKFPLVIATDYGIVKSAISELELAG